MTAACVGATPPREELGDSGQRWSFGGEAALSVEARYLEPDLPEELAQAYARTFARLRGMFRARGCSPEEAADLAQEAAVRAYMHVRRWGVTGVGLDPLLNRIARNLLIDRYRRTTPHIVPLDEAGELHDPDQDPTEEVARRQRRTAVRSAISELPVRHRAAITYSMNGMTPEEVGRRMGIGRNAADALLHRARRSLKERLQTAGEGMFGIALGIRVRLDRLLRRGEMEGRLGDVTVGAVSQMGLSMATAAVLAVLSVTGAAGSGTPTSGFRFNPVAGAAGHAGPARPSVSGPAATGDGGASVGATAGSGSGGTTYHLGPSTTTYAPDGVDNRIAIPDPTRPDGPPLLDLNQGLEQRPTDDAGPVCQVIPSLCDPTGGRGA